jgi:hypothetical protein
VTLGVGRRTAARGDEEMNLSRVMWTVAILLFVSALGCSEDSTSVSIPKYSELSDSSFAVGDSSVLEINNFAGRVDVMPGAANVVHVEVEKWAGRKQDLDAITVEMVELQNGVRVVTDNPSGLKQLSVDVEVTVPMDTRPTLQLAAGDMVYEGRAEGQCSFSTIAGTITLKLPADVNVEVLLTVAAGAIRVDFPVVGQVDDHMVDGVIGTGADGRIVAQVAAGNIYVIYQ